MTRFNFNNKFETKKKKNFVENNKHYRKYLMVYKTLISDTKYFSLIQMKIFVTKL